MGVFLAVTVAGMGGALALTRYGTSSWRTGELKAVDHAIEAALGTDSQPDPLYVTELRARAWAGAAAKADSAAVRAWVHGSVLPISGRDGRTIHVTLYQLTTRPGCPLVSRLHATLVQSPSDTLRVAELSANCPPTPSLQPATGP